MKLKIIKLRADCFLLRIKRAVLRFRLRRAERILQRLRDRADITQP